ncbi:pseudouridine synthase [Pyrodictium occultum]|uniref:Pseudouridine synthase n=1 Tax=Pyrodictium occultum TaxID=2309 RepID=A0A0V8RUA3_PYROC|nr:DUF1947 domain-containing protein [Pyrodictium occultum]KSW11653.1 pseudouridine synthase [Pyrodictium occultum]
MRRWQLSKKDKRLLLQRLRELYPRFDVSRFSSIEIAVEDGIKLFVFDGVPAFIEASRVLIPHLRLLLRHGYRDWLPYIVVDQGAVKPISRGADLMRPGIESIASEFDKDAIVVIVEPSRLLPLAVHRALYNSSEIKEMEKGRVTESLHHLGDRYWKLAENL